MKRFISVLMALILVLSFMPNMEVTAYAETTSGTCGDNLTWTYDAETYTLTISGTGPMYDYEKYYNSSNPRPWGRDVQFVVIDEGVTTIGSYAFSQCDILHSVTIPSTVTSIGDCAFSECFNFGGDLVIPDSVLSIGFRAFYYCLYIESVSFGTGLKSIGEGAFQHLSNLKHLVIPDNVTTIGKGAFAACGLEDVTLPNGLLTLEDELFYGCSSLKSVTLPDSLTSIGARVFVNDHSLKEIVIPKNVTSIGDGAFSHLPLRTVVFPATLNYLGSNTFSGCDYLKSVFFLGDAPFITNNCFTSDRFAAYYDPSNPTWTQYDFGDENDPRQDYGGRICWACFMADPELPERMAGANRTATAVAISQAIFTPEETENVVLASGDGYADALAGGPLAYMLEAPILLVCGNKFDQDTLNEIERLNVENIYILGGTGVINEDIENYITDDLSLNVERICGANRYGTAVKIAEKMDEIRGATPEAAFFAYANNYPDALAVSSVASIANVPILYIGSNGVLDGATKNYLNKCKQLELSIVLGGTGTISGQAETSLRPYGEVERIYGANRYETCILINLTFRDIVNGDSLCLAYGGNYPDALAGSVFAAYNHAPLLLVDKGTLSDLQQYYVHWKTPINVFVFGGTGVVPDSVLEQVKAAAK